MKLFTLIILTMIFNTALATESTTDCPAMNEGREKVVKPTTTSQPTKQTTAIKM